VLLGAGDRVEGAARGLPRNSGGKQIVLFFEKPSLRTAAEFEAGINSLGGAFVLCRPDAVAAGRSREPEARGAQHGTLGRRNRLRTFAHDTVTTMAEHASIPVINALSELEHPCQAMAIC